jgi:hypothetical protein
MNIAVLGIDLDKNSCSVVGLDASGQVVLRRRMQRKTIVTPAAKLDEPTTCNLTRARRHRPTRPR